MLNVCFMYEIYLNFRSKDTIREAIKDNDFLTYLEASQVKELVDVMYSKEFKKGEYIIREGEPGQHLYVIEGMGYILKLHWRSFTYDFVYSKIIKKF